MRSLLPALGRGAGWKLGADLLGRLLQYALLLIAARTLARDDFGDFSFALGIGYTLAQVADFGLQLFVQRELARLALLGATRRPFFSDEAAAGRLAGGGLAIKVGLSVLALALLTGLLDAEPVGNKPALLAVGVAMVLATDLEYIAYCFRALGRLQEEAAAIVLARGANLLIGVALLALGGGVWGLAVAANLALVTGVAFAYRRLRRYLDPELQPQWAYWRSVAWQPLALGIGIIFSMLQFRADNLLIPPLLGREALGVYNVAYKLFEPTLLLPSLILAATFPLLAQAGATPGRAGRDRLRRTLGQTVVLLTALGLAAALLLALLAEPLIGLLYGPGFDEAAGVLRLLALACIPMYVNYALTHALIALDMQRSYAFVMLLALCANVSINLALLPTLGISGAALATAGTELLLLALCGAALLWRPGRVGETRLTAGTSLGGSL